MRFSSRSRALDLRILVALGVFGCASRSSSTSSAEEREENRPSPPITVPKIWDAKALEGWATPVAGLGVAPTYFTEEEYYSAPVDNLRTYPVYHPDREPPGYRDSLLRRGAQPLIEPEKLRTREDWIEAGRRVFDELDTPASRSDDPRVLAHFTSASAVDEFRDAAHDTMAPDGTLLDYRWVVDHDGKLKLSLASCQGCHSRVLPDGQVLPGAPSNFDLSDSPAVGILLDKLRISSQLTQGEEFYAQYGVPWIEEDAHASFRRMKDEEFDARPPQDDGAPPGTMFARFNGSPFYSTRMADLRGIRDRKYLDSTATHLHRGPEDLARYCILVEYADPAIFGEHRLLPEEAMRVRSRPPDEAVYAMALYLESLDVPRSPHPFDETARRGERIFRDEGCVKCHTPPLYTNNKLVAAPGFDPPGKDARPAGLDVSDRRVGTDPGLALRTRKGTGYYRIPSLRGVWYRGLYGHSGFVASLEDWFDPTRLDDDYVPTGWRGPGVEARAVPGHEFGLDLDEEEKRALIAFLRTL